jgi:two-component system response regulator FixJ
MEVLSRLVQGKQNKVVARELAISPRTVEVHRARIMHRLGVTSFAELVRLSVRSGLAID